MNFDEGIVYKYSDLMGALEGGSHQFYLPFRGQQVFAAFLNKSKNPDAPHVILVGSKPKVARAGAILSRQLTPIPVFVKHSTDHWRYCGHFRSSHIVDRKAAAEMTKAAKRDDVAFALGLEKILGDLTSQKIFIEGKCGQVTRNVYERSDEARTICLQHYGRRCCVCNLLFEEEYGDSGVGFIHVHHLNPLHESGGEAHTDPITDLRPVCPNCHAMIHAEGKLMTPDDLRQMYWSRESCGMRKKRTSDPTT